MKTAVEASKDGTRAVYHRAGTLIVEGHVRQDEKFTWTHPESETAECVACQSGAIPEWVKRSKR